MATGHTVDRIEVQGCRALPSKIVRSILEQISSGSENLVRQLISPCKSHAFYSIHRWKCSPCVTISRLVRQVSDLHDGSLVPPMQGKVTVLDYFILI